MMTGYCLLSFLIYSSLLFVPALGSKKVYIVYFGGHSHGNDATTNNFVQATNSHRQFLGSFLQSMDKAKESIIYSYNKHINGFAAYLDEEQAIEISRHSDVISVFENKLVQLHTTRTWSFLGVEGNSFVPRGSIWTKADYGRDVIIAHLDTGVWPESASFCEDGMGPVPSRWKGSCQNNTKAGVMCTRKLIGAKYFNKAFKAEFPGADIEDSDSPRDIQGHGTHTLSTAGGCFVPNASLFNFASGTSKGGSPAAHLATYKVCVGASCTGADILAGFDEAIHDGVDVLSISLGGYSTDYFTDSIALGSFHAVLNGIHVVAAAGNDGPYDGSVSNAAPWITTVAASSFDRDYLNFVVLGNNKYIAGRAVASESLPEKKLYTLINSVDAKTDNATFDDAQLCYNETLNPAKVHGKIVICLQGVTDGIMKGFVVQQAGGVGMILISEGGEDMFPEAYLLPATSISSKDGLVLNDYMNSTKSPLGTITKGRTVLGVKPSPVLAEFSSRGPNLISPQILKPDIAAPGVNVLASYTEAHSVSDWLFDNRFTPFNILSGTSMACPHVAGVTGLLRKLYPHWSPAAVRSAIMTTAQTLDNTGRPINDQSGGKATPFGYGSGQIQPNRAMYPGLVYDMGISDYMNFICACGFNESQMARFTGRPYKCSPEKMVIENLNNPSFAIPNLNGTMTVSRTVKNVGGPGIYAAKVKAPAGIVVSIQPRVLKFREIGEEKEFKVTFSSSKSRVGKGYSFGELSWSDGRHLVTSPMAVNATS